MSKAAIYDELAVATRRVGQASARDDRELIRLATLAASSHNTQPWMFHISADGIAIAPDRARRCGNVDPDDAHLYKSLGCAAENLIHAASLQGLAAEAAYEPEVDAVVVTLEPSGQVTPTDLSEALVTRQCTRTAYDGTAVAEEDLARLEQAGTDHAVRCLLVTAAEQLEAISRLVERGNLTQLTDRAFRRELTSWIRFNPSTAVRTRDGLAGRVSGQPPLPTLVARVLAPLIITASSQARRDREHLQSSAAVAVFLTETDTRPAWVDAGRAYERFALRGDLLGVRSAFINQPLEVPHLRDELGSVLGVSQHAQLMVRFGHGRRAPYSLRRPVEDVIVAPSSFSAAPTTSPEG
jgi:hypothetical protein